MGFRLAALHAYDIVQMVLGDAARSLQQLVTVHGQHVGGPTGCLGSLSRHSVVVEHGAARLQYDCTIVQYNAEIIFTKSVKWAGTSKSYQAADIFAVRDEKVFSAMCTWSNHCLHHLLPSERDTGQSLRHTEHSYQLVCYNFSSTRRCCAIRMLCDSL